MSSSSFSSASPAETPLVIDQTTILSLLSTVFLLGAAYALSRRVQPAATTTTTQRVLFIWHMFDALIHFLFEGSFLYNCFFVWSSTAGPSTTNFLSQPLRRYGANYGTSATAQLWQEYAKADARWGEADLCVVSLEILTVFGGGPLAAWICDMVRRGDDRVWFWATVLATAELYGGFMTFAPEWLSGSLSLNTSNFMYKWVYLFFFNTLWVWIPLWVLYEAYRNIQGAFTSSASAKSNGPVKKSN
ncbi:Emopamil-binding protein [Xylona heveae TC161]|uniref:Emopamil-binding protein n=1 Tax=Xylona heveae (strain CBS 132557 / TC161) TaxID=1328760 RepID=A0A165G2Z5_XYLHT|nr:Emopamil-binding protein [Xylona heveae TC161]KZF21680.1 Emopamil-binding protein [Xylona heveae TC161]